MALGHDVGAHRAEVLPRVGALIEAPALYGYLSGRDNLRCFGDVLGGVAGSRIDEVLDLVDLRARQKDRVRAYSLGMKQRLAIAVALLHDPALLVLDEPANGLDPAGIVEIRRLLRRLAGAGRTVFMSSHVLAHVQQTCDRLAIIAAGRLVKVAPVSELVRSAGEFELRVEDPVAALAVIRAQPWGAAARDVGRLQLLAIKLTALVIVGPCLVASFALLTGAAAYVVHAAWQAGSPSGAAWGPPAAPPPPR